MTVKLIVIGDSHTGALQRARVAMIEAGRKAEVERVAIRHLGTAKYTNQRFFEDCGDHIDITHPEYRTNIERLPIPGMETARIGLSQTLYPTNVIWQMHRSKLALHPAPPGWTPITRSLFRQLVLENKRHALELLDRLKELGANPVVISSPGLFQSSLEVRSLPTGLAVRIFKAHQAVMLAELAARQVPVVDIPAECLDPEGYMLASYRRADPDDHIHANAAFGRLMMEQLLQLIGP